MSSPNEEIISELSLSISESVNGFIKAYEYKKGRPPLYVTDPGKAQEVLLMYAAGSSGKKIQEKTGVNAMVLANLKSNFADYLGQWKELGGQISGGLYMDSSERLSELMEEHADARRRKDWREVDALNKAIIAHKGVFETSHRQSMNARGEATQIHKVNQTYTVEDVDKAAEDALKLIQEAEIVE